MRNYKDIIREAIEKAIAAHHAEMTKSLLEDIVETVYRELFVSSETHG